jgi:hypothetical protein
MIFRFKLQHQFVFHSFETKNRNNHFNTFFSNLWIHYTRFLRNTLISSHKQRPLALPHRFFYTKVKFNECAHSDEACMGALSSSSSWLVRLFVASHCTQCVYIRLDQIAIEKCKHLKTSIVRKSWARSEFRFYRTSKILQLFFDFRIGFFVLRWPQPVRNYFRYVFYPKIEKSLEVKQ